MDNWKNFFESYQKQSRRLVFVSCLSAVFFILLLGAIGIMAYLQYAKPIRPMFVGVDSLGNIVKVGNLDESIDIDKVKGSDLILWITSCRAVTKDPLLRQENLATCSSRLINNSEPYTLIDNYLRENNPSIIADSYSVLIKPINLLRTDVNTFFLEWSENYFDNSSTHVRRDVFTASIRTIYQQSNDPTVFRQNPIGTYIKSLSWSIKQ